MKRKYVIWYNSWHKSSKQRRRAVSTHSKFACPNRDGFSRYIPNEELMHHTERKETKLPCGYTVAESWAALRKSWLGFKISYSNSDSIRATEYASIITKIQVEMGIPTTNFDPDILDEETVSNIKARNMGTDESPDGLSEIVIEDPDAETEDELPIYEEILNNPSTTNIKNGPREEIFEAYRGREKSCPWVRQSEVDEDEEETDFELETIDNNPKLDDAWHPYATDEETTSEVTKQVEQTRKSCYYRRRKQTRNSCYYKRQGN